MSADNDVAHRTFEGKPAQPVRLPGAGTNDDARPPAAPVPAVRDRPAARRLNST